ncbi:MAG: aminoacyl-tRNA hydrolase [Bacteroidetes bacterium CG2_30_33_31]|nr:MAG: aminoacyl-tRNA hydrolase [Bacteroidetes bacterium CG2_30_33_31]
MKYLIVGLGNVGKEYEFTRHNIGFEVVNDFAAMLKVEFVLERHAFVAKTKYAAKVVVIIKPTTFMNLSGKAVRYWMEKENIPISNIIVVVDDLALPFGKIRLRKKGSAGSHNGLIDIIQLLGRNDFARIRCGIGSDFARGFQADFVLSKWDRNEEKMLPEIITTTSEMIKSCIKSDIDSTMAKFN